jgi:hypothetical protein
MKTEKIGISIEALAQTDKLVEPSQTLFPQEGRKR